MTLMKIGGASLSLVLFLVVTSTGGLLGTVWETATMGWSVDERISLWEIAGLLGGMKGIVTVVKSIDEISTREINDLDEWSGGIGWDLPLLLSRHGLLRQ